MAEKLFYSMGEVAEMFDVNASLIRHWESQFSVIRPKRNKKGNRLFSPQDVENLKLIYHLVKERVLRCIMLFLLKFLHIMYLSDPHLNYIHQNLHCNRELSSSQNLLYQILPVRLPYKFFHQSSNAISLHC